MITLSEEIQKLERATDKFISCNNAGATMSIQVDSKTKTKAVLGWCSHEGRKIDIEPTCRICLRHEKIKKTPKKLGAATARIRRGKARKTAKEEALKKFRRTGLGAFGDPTNSL